MIRYSEALDIFSKEARRWQDSPFLDTEYVLLRDLPGRILAEDLFSPESYPAFTNAAMDGFALNSEYVNSQIQKSGQVKLTVVGKFGAGDPIELISNYDLSTQNCLEIMTGAFFPSEVYDAVVKIEDVKLVDSDRSIVLTQPLARAENVRKKGSDIQIKDKLLSMYVQIRETDLIALATLGVLGCKVFRLPRVAIISTGNELRSATSGGFRPGQIRNSTGVFLDKWLEENQFHVSNLGVCTDSSEEFCSLVHKALKQDSDIIISTGAVSMGKFDFITSALEKLDAEILFHKVAIRPGKPILLAALNITGKRKYFLGLPGNPVSTAVGARFFLKPFVDQIAFQKNRPEYRLAQLATDTKKPEHLRCFFTAKTFQDGITLGVQILPRQQSYMVSPILEANAWAVLSEEYDLVRKNTIIEVYDL